MQDMYVEGCIGMLVLLYSLIKICYFLLGYIANNMYIYIYTCIYIYTYICFLAARNGM